jgi:peptidoglycan/LPS O-acetylase OafA/YrhL
MAAPRAQLPALTSVRFLAAIHVVFYHYGRPLFASAGPPLRYFVGNGFAGVSFFFVLSGFILAYTYADAAGPRWARDFWVARLARVYPLYAAALALTGALLAITHPHASAATIAQSGIASLILIQSWVPAWVGVWNIPGWSLSDEAFFYLAFPAILPFLARGSRVRLVVAGACASAAAMVVPLAYSWADPDGLGASMPDGDTPLLELVKYAPVLHLPQFVVGAAFGCAFATRPEGDRARSLALPGMVAAAIAITALSLPYGRLFPLLHNGLLASVFGALIYCLADGRGPLVALLRTPGLPFLGRASYALYLLQHPLSIAVPNALKRLGLPPSPASFFIMLACLLAASAVALVAIEEPGRRWIRKTLGNAGVPAVSPAIPS